MSYRVAVIGEGVIDRFVESGAHHDVIGGSPLNTAVALQRAGVESHWWARVSDSSEGQAIWDYAVSNMVSHPELIRSAEPAPIVTIELSTQGVPAYDFALEGAADWQWSTDECEGLKSGYDLIQIGSLTAVMQPGSDALLSTLRTIKTHSPETLISFDPNARPAAAPDVATANAMRSRIVEFVDLADVIKVSDEDLEWIDSSLSPDATAANWSLRGPQLVIMTRGEKGSTAFVQGKAVVHVSTVEVSLVDTVGAGDTYMAWVVRGLIADHNARVTTNTADLEKLLSTAAQAAAITCSRKGCNPPLLSEVAL